MGARVKVTELAKNIFNNQKWLEAAMEGMMATAMDGATARTMEGRMERNGNGDRRRNGNATAT